MMFTKTYLIFGIFQVMYDMLAFILVQLICGVVHIEHVFLSVQCQFFNIMLSGVQMITVIYPGNKTIAF